MSTSTNGGMSYLPPATGSSKINIGLGQRLTSALGGAALTVMGIRNLNSLSGITMMVGGGVLLARGLSGYCPVTNLVDRQVEKRVSGGMEAKGTYTVYKDRQQVYDYWRQLDNLPNFMEHLETVEQLDDRRSRWTAKLPGGIGSVSWDAEIAHEIPGEVISWRSLPGSTIDNAGEVRFTDSPLGGTEVSVHISYRLPAGDLGSVAAKMFNPLVERMVKKDIRSFKRLLETGDTPALHKGKKKRAVAETSRTTIAPSIH